MAALATGSARVVRTLIWYRFCLTPKEVYGLLAVEVEAMATSACDGQMRSICSISSMDLVHSLALERVLGHISPY